ncbi:MAG: hypothetical protein KDA24_29915, partial [Deltaproteobacteria bacterium]|nr:hypothetical protein [Deltaproteobacteria bacterium]
PPRTRSALEMLTDEPSDADAPVPRPVREPRPATLAALLDENRNGTTSGKRKAVGPRKGEQRDRRLEDVGRDTLKLITGEMAAVKRPVSADSPTLVDATRLPGMGPSPLEGGLREEDSMLEPLRET